ncbi:MAG TPA: AI-2E family transporter [Limnochordia bacterium]
MAPVWRGLLLIAAGVIGAWLVYRLRASLAPFLLASMVAYLMYPLVVRFEARRVPRPLAILLVYAIFAVAGVIGYYALVPPLARQLRDLVTLLPEQSERLQGMTQGAVDGLNRLQLPAVVRRAIDRALTRAEDSLDGWAERAADATFGLFSGAISLVAALVLAYYVLRDRERMLGALLDIVPAVHRGAALALLREVDAVIAGFVRGQLIVSLVIGTAIGIGLSLLGVRYALIVGLIAGIFDVIPYFGPLIGAVPAVALALLRSPWTALWAAVLIFAINQLEGSLLSPKIVGNSVGLHPLAVIFAVLAGGELAGVIGMLVAVPAMAAGRVIVRGLWPYLRAAWLGEGQAPPLAAEPVAARPGGVDKDRGLD